MLVYLECILSFCANSFCAKLHGLYFDYARVAIADAGGWPTPTCDWFVQGYHAALKCFSKGENFTQLDQRTAVGLENKISLERANTYAEWLLRLHSRRPFELRNGYVGLTAAHVATGDVVCIFLGRKGVYCLRPHPCTIGQYTVVGEAYVHGVIYDEIMNNKPKKKSFVLL
jgi:hypothetical protein